MLQKSKMTKDEEQRVKLAAKELYKTLTEKRKELFVVDWVNDSQTREKVKRTIGEVLNKTLPDSYEREVFSMKSNLVFDHIVDQAITGYGWVA